MYQPNVPRKTTALIQTWGCVLLALLCVFFSFSPLITLDTGLNSADIKEVIEEITDKPFTADIPEEVDVSAVKLISSITLMADVIGVLTEDSGAVNQQKVNDLEKLLTSPEGINTMVTIAAIASTVTGAIDFEGDMNVGMVLSMLNEKGITANCEVDTVNAIAMHMLSLAANAPGACLDWNNNYGEEEDSCVLFHCGPTACSLMEKDCRIVDHPMFARVLGCGNGLGCNEGRMKNGLFTWASGITREGKLSFVLDKGSFGPEKLPEEFFGCGGVAHFEDFQKKLLFLLRKGFPHHMTLSYGDHFTAVEEAVNSYLHYDLFTFEK